MPSWQVSLNKGGEIQVFRDGLSVRHASLKAPVQALSRRLGAVVPDHVADLVEVACAIHAVDRLISRRHGQHRWNRSLRLQLPVRRPDLWLRPDIAESLLDS